MATHKVELYSPSGTVKAWDDSMPGDDPPMRTNAPRQPHRYLTVPAGVVVLRALIGGALIPDASLGGDLFTWWWSHYGEGPVPGMAPTAGTGAEVTFTLTAANQGLWLATAYRANNGAVLFGVCLES